MKKILTIASFVCLALFVAFLFKGCTLTADEITRSVDFTWTATGDNGNLGTASAYQIRYSLSADSLANNWTLCKSLDFNGLIPEAFTPMSWTTDVVVPTEGTYYFAIKAADERWNWSGISNIIYINFADEIAPAAIGDFNVNN